MKIIFLNTENGKYKKELEEYLKYHQDTTEIFCFQEAYENMFQIGLSILNHFNLTSDYKKKNDDDFSQATYVNNDIRIISTNILLKDILNIGLGIHTKIEINGRIINIANIHGKAYPGNKLDDEERILQSKEIIKYFKDIKEPIIIGGDFNLDLNTKSIAMFEEAGYINLIKKFGIKNTRNRYAWERYPQTPQYFADFIFISPNIKVKSFTVEENEISDHLPMVLDINI